MANNYVIEPLRDRIFDELGPLMLNAFGRPGDKEYFDWKYRENPAGPAIGNIARSSTGEIAAFYGMIPEIYAFEVSRQLIYQSCDTMTHAEHRRRGLFQRLAEQTYREALAVNPGFFAYGFGGPTSTPGFVKMGWQIEERLPFLFQSFPITLLRRGGRKAAVLSSANADLIAMMKQAQPTNGPAVERSEQFLRWRLDNPRAQYEFVVSDAAYAVFKRMERFLFVLDFWEQDRPSGSPVIAALRRIAADGRMKGLLTWTSAYSEFGKRLRGHLFLRNRLGRGPASETTPFITYGADPFPTVRQPWPVNPLDHDSY